MIQTSLLTVLIIPRMRAITFLVLLLFSLASIVTAGDEDPVKVVGDAASLVKAEQTKIVKKLWRDMGGVGDPMKNVRFNKDGYVTHL